MNMAVCHCGADESLTAVSKRRKWFREASRPGDAIAEDGREKRGVSLAWVESGNNLLIIIALGPLEYLPEYKIKEKQIGRTLRGFETILMTGQRYLSRNHRRNRRHRKGNKVRKYKCGE